MNERKPLTLEELRKMDGKPAYWPDDKSYGIISVDSAGKWAGIPFFRGRKNEANFEFDIESRGMKVYEIDPPRLNREAWEPCDFCKTELDKYPYILACDDYSESNTVYESGFCPLCGRPLLEEAWAMLEKRLEACANEHQ